MARKPTLMSGGKILGIWDGHDAGAAVVSENGKILAAVNEERFSRKKMHAGFPYKSVEACLEVSGLSGDEISDVAFSTTDWAKTTSRLFPKFGQMYYQFRRRKTDRPAFVNLVRYFKFISTQPARPKALLRRVNEAHVSGTLRKMGFGKFRIHAVDHHAAHAATAYFPSGFADGALCVTLDGIGDGLSGTINYCEDGRIDRIAEIPARDSIGIFFEQVTTVLGMRELEDEGKVMSLADYSHKTSNKMAGLFSVDGLRLRARLGPIAQYNFLERLAWRTPPEDFAKMAQDTLEETLLKLFSNALRETGAKKVCWAGGVASNIKLNQRIRQELRPKDWFIFPHMGDGGLAAGAALLVAGVPYERKLSEVYFGPSETKESVLDELGKRKVFRHAEERRNGWQKSAAEILGGNDFFFLFQGKMEYGPRALGNRSIIAPASSMEVKNELNLRIKERNWYQPFCPSILEGEARRLFTDYDGVPDKFMTMGYSCKASAEKKIAAATHIDNSARPQMVGKENAEYLELLSEVRRKTGTGAVLNTSFNFHGDPIVCRISEALDMMERTGTRHMFAEGVHIELKAEKGRK
ncbi:MAG: carbamoyltransferase C-terminal domain-containing protein [archaeon]